MNYAAVLLIGVMALAGRSHGAPALASEALERGETQARYAPRGAPSQTPRAPSTRSAPRCSGERGATSSTGPARAQSRSTLSAAGIDYVRVLGSVGGASWEDRETDPRWPDYDAIIAGMTDLAYDRYGMRVQWTLFGGAPFTPPAPRRGPRSWIASRRLARGREHKIFAFEIANEAWQNGFRGAEGLAELRKPGQAPERQDGRARRPQLAATGRRMRDIRRRGRRCDDAALRPRIRQPGPDRAAVAALEFSGGVRPCMSRRIASCRLQQRADWARELGQAGRFAVENCRGVRDDVSRRQRQLRSARRSWHPRRRRGGRLPEAPAPRAFRRAAVIQADRGRARGGETVSAAGPRELDAARAKCCDSSDARIRRTLFGVQRIGFRGARRRHHNNRSFSAHGAMRQSMSDKRRQDNSSNT